MGKRDTELADSYNSIQDTFNYLTKSLSIESEKLKKIGLNLEEKDSIRMYSEVLGLSTGLMKLYNLIWERREKDEEERVGEDIVEEHIKSLSNEEYIDLFLGMRDLKYDEVMNVVKSMNVRGLLK